jgi:beta-lactamase regulating signal transducer with metallopeptidase domain
MSETVLRAVGWLLVDSALYVLLLALSAAVVLQAASRRRASLRYAIAYGALQLALLITLIDVAGTLANAAHAGRGPRATSRVPVVVEAEQQMWNGQWVGTSYRTQAASETRTERLIASVDPLMPWAAGAWLIGVALVVAWHLGGSLRVRRLLLRSWPTGVALSACLKELSARLGVREPVRLAESAEAVVPMVTGLRRPTIILPQHFTESVGPASVESLLVHELAHVCRRDLLANWAQTLVEALFFFHPGVWWLSRVVRQEREHCCDDMAVRLLKDELLYARSLLRLQEGHSLWPQGSMTATGAAFALRIGRLCGRQQGPGTTLIRRAASAAFAGITAVAVILALSAWHGPLALTVMARGPQSTAALGLGLVAHYPFDGDARDVSGQGNDGFVQGARLTTDRFGRANAAYDFDGVRARIVAPAAEALMGTGPVSVSCWVSPRSHGKWESWAAKAGLGGDHSQWRVGLGLAADEWGFTEYTKLDRGNAWEDYWLKKSPIPLGVWSHVVAVLDTLRREVTLYRNGARLATFSSIELPSASPGKLFVGYQTDDGVYFDGKIDDLRVYARSLTAGEVRALYQERP